jgi:hypothetical protein
VEFVSDAEMALINCYWEGRCLLSIVVRRTYFCGEGGRSRVLKCREQTAMKEELAAREIATFPYKSHFLC